jgi:hypothetical protein
VVVHACNPNNLGGKKITSVRPAREKLVRLHPKNKIQARPRRLTPIILATQEVEIRRNAV